MKQWLSGLALLLSAIGALPAIAGEFLYLDYRDLEMGGYNEIHLKRDLQNAYPGYRLEDFDVRTIQVETKLFDRTGDVSVRVGNYMSERRGISGDPRQFYNPDPRTYAQLYFSIPRTDGRGPWQILLNGSQFRIRRVAVEVERAYGGYPPPPPGPGPGPGYPPPPPPPHERYMEIDCQNWDRRPTYCGAPFPIRSARIVRQYSHSDCVEGRSWFIDGSGLRVQDGCRARFGVWGY